MKTLCSPFQMFLFCLWQRGSGLRVKVLWYWTVSFLPHALASDPRPVRKAETGTLCVNRVFMSMCYRTGSVSIGVFFFLTLRGTIPEFTCRSYSLAIGRAWEVSAGLSRPDVSCVWTVFSFFPFSPSSLTPPSPLSCQLLLEMFFPLFKVIADSVPKPSYRQALKINLQRGLFSY